MILALRREPFSEKSIKGELFNDEQFFCYTLERPLEGDIVAIPAGVYDIEIRHSPHFDRDLPHLLNVPERSDILMHGGNKAIDSLGCILCGYKEFDEDTIGDASAVSDLTRIIAAAKANNERVQIRVIDP